MAMVIDLPARLVPRDHNFRLDGTSSGQRGLDGRSQVLGVENRIWRASVVFPKADRADAQIAEAIGDELRGRLNVLRVPVKNAVTPLIDPAAPSYLDGLGFSATQQAAGGVTFSDGSMFSDGARYALPGAFEPIAGDAVQAGVSILRLEGFLGRNLQVGAFFSINDFLYRVSANADGFVTFNPPLREGVAAGAVVKVSQPLVRMRLAADDGWRQAIRYEAWAEEFTVDLEEAFER